MQEINKENLKEFYSHIAKLKSVKRQGWLNRGLKEEVCESVADHSFGTAALTLALMKNYPNLNQEKLLKMAVVHDLSESIIGDITPGDNISDEEKDKTELLAAKKIFSNISEEFVDIFKEYQEKKTPEAKLISQIDKLEMSYQAEHYEDKIDTEEFKESAKRKITDDKLKKLL